MTPKRARPDAFGRKRAGSGFNAWLLAMLRKGSARSVSMIRRFDAAGSSAADVREFRPPITILRRDFFERGGYLASSSRGKTPDAKLQ